jgi:hypothetical protein
MSDEELVMVEPRPWQEFRDTGMLWWINQQLHMFGWAVATELDEEGNVISTFPARVKFRGFSEEINTRGYIKVSKYLQENILELLQEAKD